MELSVIDAKLLNLILNMLGLLLSLQHDFRSLRAECSSKNGAGLDKSSGGGH